MKRLLGFVLAIILVLSTIVTIPTMSASYLVGDADGDGKTTAADVNVLKKAFAGIIVLPDSRAADINGDGAVGTVDINLLMRYLAGIYIIVQPGDDDAEGTLITEYVVIYPENATVYEQYAAELLCDYVSDNYSLTLTMENDSVAETDKEILIGNTNRTESTTSATLGTSNYIFKKVNDKIVMLGTDFMVGAGVGDLTYDYMAEGMVLSDNLPTDDTLKDYTPREAKNAILMIGDGMGFNQVAFTNSYLKRSTYASYNYKGFVAENLVNKGECTTYCLYPANPDMSVYYKRTTDSAAAGTALATGIKTTKGTLGQSGFGLPYQNIMELAVENGYNSAVVSSEASTGATPAAFTSHTSSRSNKDEILSDQETTMANGTIIDCGSYDDILAHTIDTLDKVSSDDKGFVMMVEEAYIDKACHYLDGDYTKLDLALFVRRFNSIIQYVLTFAVCRPDTIVVITADHETGGLTKLGGSTDPGNHTNANVPIYAIGDGTDMFNGTISDNIDIPKLFASKLFGVENFGGNLPTIEPSVFISYSGVAQSVS